MGISLLQSKHKIIPPDKNRTSNVIRHFRLKTDDEQSLGLIYPLTTNNPSCAKVSGQSINQPCILSDKNVKKSQNVQFHDHFQNQWKMLIRSSPNMTCHGFSGSRIQSKNLIKHSNILAHEHAMDVARSQANMISIKTKPKIIPPITMITADS